MAQDVTALDSKGIERLVDQFLPVPPDAIEQEFDRIWRESSRGGQDASSVRLRVSNLVAWGREQEAGERFEAVMERLASRHPCRGILAVTADDAVDVESAISAHCWRTQAGGRNLCSEEILLRSRPGQEALLASAVSALLVPELPVHAWLVGEPDVARRLPEEVLEAADTVVIDCGAATLQGLGLRALQRALAALDARVVDMAWTRSSHWRDLLAQFFDTQEALERLERVESIRVEGGAGGISAAAYLVAGWLVSRLGLSIASASASNMMTSATLYDGTRGVQLTITPGAAGHEIESLVVSAGGATFELTMHAESGHILVGTDLPATPMHRTVVAEAADDAELLLAAIEGAEDPSVIREAVGAAIALLDG